jgi:vitamin B12/bleomycin/antimicrobial peptide transport system ATP-binding/permease protein
MRAAESGALKAPAIAARRAFRPAITGFHRVIGRWRRVIREHCRLTWLTNGNAFFAPVLPLLLAAPNYINGHLSLGAVMQVAAAFTIVLGALNWLTDNYIRLAEWSASAKRVDELRHALLVPGDEQKNTH